MNAGLQIADTKSNIQTASRRDQGSGKSEAASSSTDFGDVLAGVGDPAATADPDATTKLQLAATSTATPKSIPTTVDTTFLKLLFDQTPSTSGDDDSGQATSTSDDTKTPSTIEAQPDNPASLALNAAFAALQVVAGTGLANTSRSSSAPTIAEATTPSAATVMASAMPGAKIMATKLATSNPAIISAQSSPSRPDSLDTSPPGSSAAVSAVKVATHLAGSDSGASGLQDETTAGAAPIEGGTTASHSDATARATEDSTSTRTSPTVTASDSAPVVVPATTSPTQAVSNVIAKTLDAPLARTTSEAPTPAVPAPPRTMTLQLTPANLGTVNVTMHLVGQSLDLRIAASEKDTLGTISRDRDILSKAVQDQGYDLRTLVVQGSDSSAGSTGDSNTTRDQGSRQSQTGSERQDAQSSPGRQQESGSSSQRQRRTSDDTSGASDASRAGAMFV